jgi:hypothetical protein
MNFGARYDLGWAAIDKLEDFLTESAAEIGDFVQIALDFSWYHIALRAVEKARHHGCAAMFVLLFEVKHACIDHVAGIEWHTRAEHSGVNGVKDHQSDHSPLFSKTLDSYYS